MSPENVEIARRNWERWRSGADHKIARQLAADVEWHHNIGVGSPMEGIYRGREEVLGLSTAIRESFGVARVGIEDVRDLSSTEVLVLGSLHLEGRGSGAAVTTPFGAVTEIRDGLVMRQRFWTDQGEALEAAGLRGVA
jgi:ketosteroid isomerase-like protein